MIPTNEQIITEAERRWDAEQGTPRQSVIGHVIEIVRENWTPPEPVDPDVLAYREWRAELYQDPALRKDVLAGKWDHPQSNAFRAGARMAREQERAKVLVEYVETDARRLDGVGGSALAALAKHRGEA